MLALKEILPIEIPPTSKARYVSFDHALNLRMPKEDTGDWHFEAMFFNLNGRPDRKAHLAGDNCAVNTNKALGSLGIRNMGEQLSAWSVVNPGTEVFAANHYRAIADMVFEQISHGQAPRNANVRAINSWLHTQEEIDTLKTDYIKPLGTLFTGTQKEIFDAWIPTLIWD